MRLARIIGLPAIALVLGTAGIVLAGGCADGSATIDSGHSNTTTEAMAVSTTGASTTEATTIPGSSTTATAGPSTTAGTAPVVYGDSTHSLQSGGRVRSFLLHVPPSYDGSKDVPLVLAYHGRGGTGKGQALLTHMSDVADVNGFLVVYPDGVNNAWNDGRKGLDDTDASIDDVGFTRDLIRRLQAQYKIDANRVYATGFSRGGFMCYRLARDLPDMVSAIAPVSGLLSQDLAGDFSSTAPVSLLLIMGTADPLVPYEGGEVASVLGLNRGTVLSAPGSAAFFVKLDGCPTAGSTVSVPNSALLDGATAARTSWVGGRQGAEVQLYTVTGGGHTWPGGLQYSPVRVAGPTCRDFDASRVIWEFFATHPRAG